MKPKIATKVSLVTVWKVNHQHNWLFWGHPHRGSVHIIMINWKLDLEQKTQMWSNSFCVANFSFICLIWLPLYNSDDIFITQYGVCIVPGISPLGHSWSDMAQLWLLLMLFWRKLLLYILESGAPDAKMLKFYGETLAGLWVEAIGKVWQDSVCLASLIQFLC